MLLRLWMLACVLCGCAEELPPYAPTAALDGGDDDDGGRRRRDAGDGDGDGDGPNLETVGSVFDPGAMYWVFGNQFSPRGIVSFAPNAKALIAFPKWAASGSFHVRHDGKLIYAENNMPGDDLVPVNWWYFTCDTGCDWHDDDPYTITGYENDTHLEAGPCDGAGLPDPRLPIWSPDDVPYCRSRVMDGLFDADGEKLTERTDVLGVGLNKLALTPTALLDLGTGDEVAFDGLPANRTFVAFRSHGDGFYVVLRDFDDPTNEHPYPQYADEASSFIRMSSNGEFLFDEPTGDPVKSGRELWEISKDGHAEKVGTYPALEGDDRLAKGIAYGFGQAGGIGTYSLGAIVIEPPNELARIDADGVLFHHIGEQQEMTDNVQDVLVLRKVARLELEGEAEVIEQKTGNYTYLCTGS